MSLSQRFYGEGLVVESMLLSIIRNSRSGAVETHSVEDEEESLVEDDSLIQFNEEMEKQFPRWVAGT